MTKEVDLRKLFAGDDPARIVRQAAKELLELGEMHGRERERKAMLSVYTSAPSLEVTVEQVRYNPPLWRMTTVAPLTEQSGRVSVTEPHREHLAAEMRVKARSVLLRSGFFDEPGVTIQEKYEKARQLATSMRIDVRGTILLADGQRYQGEYRR